MIIYLIPSLIVAWFLIKRFILERMFINMEGKWILVTGCDSGFGKLMAIRSICKNVNVIAGCYTESGREELMRKAETLDKSEYLYTIRLDITNDQSVQDSFNFVKKTLEANNASLWGIVNNAGVFSIFGPDDWCSIKQYSDSLNVNCLGTIRMCHQFLPLLKESKGRIVTMGSSAGRLHGQFVAPYCIAKFAVEAYMDCLRLELRHFGVSVHILEPGAFKTELLNESAQNERIDNIWSSLSEETKKEYGETFKKNFKSAWNIGVNLVANSNLDWVVDHYSHALFSYWPRLRYYTGYDSMFLFVPLSLLPTSFQDYLLSFMYSLQPGPSLIPLSLESPLAIPK